MQEYYGRLLRQVWQDVKAFWKSQIAVGLVAGAVTAVINGVSGASPLTLIIRSVSVGTIGYVSVLGVFFLGVTVFAPVKLDRQRKSEVAERTSELIEMRTQIAELRDALSRKHPHDEHVERMVRSELQKLEEREVEYVKLLLDCGEMGNSATQRAGFHSMPNSIIQKTGNALIVFRSYCPGNGTVEMDRFHFINPATQTALRNVLYPTGPDLQPSE